MPSTAALDLRVWRNDDVYELPIRVTGMDLASVALAAQIRACRDAPGPPLVDLLKVANGNAEGLRVAGVSTVGGVPVTDLRLRLNKSTRQALPYAGEMGDDTALVWALLIGGRTRIEGRVIVLAHAYGSDAAPVARPDGRGGGARAYPSSGASLTIEAEEVVSLMVDGADMLGDIAASAQAAAAAALVNANRAAASAGLTIGARYAVDGQGPAIDSGILDQSSLARLERAALANIEANRTKWSGSTDDYFRAAPGYPGCYMSDYGLTVAGMPKAFTAAQLIGIQDRFYARASDGSGANGNTSITGELPMALNPDGTVLTYYSAWDKAHRHATGDGAFLAPLVEEQIWLKTGSAARITAGGVGAKLKAALDAIPVDPATGMVRVVAGDEWVPWGFQEMSKFTGTVLLGSVFYWRALAALANLFRQAGDTTTGDALAGRADKITAYLKAADCPLRDLATGMYCSSTGQSRAIDVMGSSFASRWNLIPPVSQAAVSDYLYANYATLTYLGFWKQTPGSWPVTGVTPTSGGAPYQSWSQTYPESTFPYAGGTYQHAYWSVGNEWVLEALAFGHGWQAALAVGQFVTQGDVTQEYYAPGHGPNDPAQGFNQNLCSPTGTVAFASRHPELLQIRLRTQGILGGMARNDLVDQLGGFVNAMVAPLGGDAVSYVSRGGIARTAGVHVITDDDFTAGISLRLKAGSATAELIDRTVPETPVLAWEQGANHARMGRQALELGEYASFYIAPGVGVFLAVNASFRNGVERPFNPTLPSYRLNIATGQRQTAPPTNDATAAPAWVAA